MKKLSKKKITLICVLTPVAALISAFLILCAVTMGMYSPTYFGRVFTHWDSSVSDYKFFPERTIKKSDRPYVYAKNINPELEKFSVFNGTLKNFIKKTDTTSFIIAKNDTIIYEQYENGYDENSVNTSFSMSKSVVSLLIGKAIEKGCLKSVDEPIKNYITEFEDKEIGDTTIADLLSMRSQIVYDEDKFLWFGDDSLTYWSPDLRALALSHTALTDQYGGNFHYNNYHPLLLGIILERSTRVTVSEFFEREIWDGIGAEFDASWSLDSRKSGFEKMESGINFRAVDFLKIGSAVLHGGFWNGTQIINGEWLKSSCLSDFPLGSEYENTFLNGRNIGYKYMWYSSPEGDIAAWGKSDQILFISPSTNTVILRTGKTDGGISDWFNLLKRLSTQI